PVQALRHPRAAARHRAPGGRPDARLPRPPPARPGAGAGPVAPEAPMSTLALPRPRAAAVAYGPAFALFVLLHFVLYVRPNDTVRALYGWELSAAVILPCLRGALPQVLDGLGPRRLMAEPLVTCVLLLNLAVTASSVHLGVDKAAEVGFGFFKYVLYVLLLRGLVTDAARLRAFVWWLPLFIAVTA